MSDELTVLKSNLKDINKTDHSRKRVGMISLSKINLQFKFDVKLTPGVLFLVDFPPYNETGQTLMFLMDIRKRTTSL